MTSLKVATARLFDRLRPADGDAVDADIVVAPASIEEAAEVIGHAADSGLTVSIRGGGTHTGLGGRITTDIAVLTTRLDRIVDYQPDDLTIVVEGGMRLLDLHEVLTEKGQTAAFPEQAGDATVGGVVAAGISGFRRLRYGPTRDRVLQVTMATGYGRVVTGGGRVVKNSTGYDLPRLAVGSLGSLGLIGSVCLKLWPQPRRTATVAVDDPAAALAGLYRPLAVVETEAGSWAYLGGTEAEIAAHCAVLGAGPVAGLGWPQPLTDPVRFSLRVPPAAIGVASSRVREVGDVRYRAQHGVGVVDAGIAAADPQVLLDLRRWAESLGGSLVLLEGDDTLYGDVGAWGSPPSAAAIQKRLKEAFDPAGVMCPGKLPGERA